MANVDSDGSLSFATGLLRVDPSSWRVDWLDELGSLDLTQIYSATVLPRYTIALPRETAILYSAYIAED